MRQYARMVQLSSLDPEAHRKLLIWQQDHGYTTDEYLAPPTIGQMIEYIDEHTPSDSHLEILRERRDDGQWSLNRIGSVFPVHTQLADVLWDELAHLLESE